MAGPDSIDILSRFGYHPGTPETIPQHQKLREGFIAFAEFLKEQLPDGRAKSTAFTYLQISSMWANFGIAETAPVVTPEAEGQMMLLLQNTVGEQPPGELVTE